jgi:hypothetical protein
MNCIIIVMNSGNSGNSNQTEKSELDKEVYSLTDYVDEWIEESHYLPDYDMSSTTTEI